MYCFLFVIQCLMSSVCLSRGGGGGLILTEACAWLPAQDLKISEPWHFQEIDMVYWRRLLIHLRGNYSTLELTYMFAAFMDYWCSYLLNNPWPKELGKLVKQLLFVAKMVAVAIELFFQYELECENDSILCCWPVSAFWALLLNVLFLWEETNCAVTGATTEQNTPKFNKSER